MKAFRSEKISEQKLGAVFCGCILFLSALAYGRVLSYKDLALPNDGIKKPPTTISAKDAKADLDLAIFAFREGYGGYPHLPKNETDKFISTLKDFQSKTQVSVMDLCNLIGDAMWEIPDNHLRAQLNNDNCGFKRQAAKRVGAVGTNFGKEEARKDKVPFISKTEKIKDKTVGKLSIIAFPFKEAPEWNGYQRFRG